MSLETLLHHLLTQRKTVSPKKPANSVIEWWDALQTIMAQWPTPIDQAIAGGFAASCMGYAFVAGYQTALRRLFPALPASQMVSLCVTEEKGNHPKVLETSLTAVNGQWMLNGRKKWASLSNKSGLLLVAAVRDTMPNGQKDIVLVQVPTDAAGVTVQPMPPTPFVPEVTHGRIQLDGVIVEVSSILPRNGYAQYIKPFRTIEDTFVSAAVASLLLHIAFAHQWKDATVNEILSVMLVLRSVGTADYHDPAVHILLEGALTTLRRLANINAPHWANVPSAETVRWQRDLPLLQVVRSARARRYERAWQAVEAKHN